MLNVVIANEPLWFYYPKLYKHTGALRGHLCFILFMVVVLTLAYYKLVTKWPLLILISASSFRVDGSYVLAALTKAPIFGFDLVVVYWLVGHFLQFAAVKQNVVSSTSAVSMDTTACAISILMILRNVKDLVGSLKILS